MRAFITDIKRFAVHDGDGIRSTVFFKGCPLKCVWCHNPENIGFENEIGFYPHKCIGCGVCVGVCEKTAHSIKDGVHYFDRTLCDGCGKCCDGCTASALISYGRYVETNEIVKSLLEDKDFYISSGGGITLSGGECLVQSKACREILAEIKKAGINTAVDTCGMVKRENILDVIEYTDIFLYDIKAISPEVHKRCTGYDNGLILDNLRFIDGTGKKTEIRVPLVPGYNSDEIPLIADFVRNLKNVTAVRVLPYHNLSGSKYGALSMENTMPPRVPAEKELDEARAVFYEKGINVK